ncbi:MAG: hypothetical protein KDC49_15640 [Saprospiraceae bacterium]|nr:hypothetical protein [Saprospiraceae bacterium]
MAEIYTDQKNMLVKFIYGECDLFETLEVEHALEENKAFKAEFLKLKKSLALLKNTEYSPGKKSMNVILEYSRNKSTALS